MRKDSTATVLSSAADFVAETEQLLKRTAPARRERGEGSVYYETAKKMWVATLRIENPQPGQPKLKVFRAAGPEEGRDAARAKKKAIAKRDKFAADAQDNKTLLQKGRRQVWTVSAWVDSWLENVVRPRFDPRTGRKVSGHAATTYTTTENLVRLYIRPHFQNVTLGELTTVHVQAWLNLLQKQLMARGLTVVQAIEARKRLVQALNYAISLHTETNLQFNAAEYVAAPEYTAPQVELLDEADMVRLQVTARAEGMGPMVLLGSAGGLRRQEFAGAQWGDLQGRVLKIQRKVNRLPLHALEGHPAARVDGRRKKQPKTTLVVQDGVKMGDPNSYRLVPISQTVLDELLAHRQWLADQARFAGASWTGPDPMSDAGWMFPADDGNFSCPMALYDRYKAVCKKAGVDVTKLHQLRHEALSTAIKRGAAPWKVQQLAGHAQLATTLNIYGHFRPSDLHDVADDLGDYYTAMANVTGASN